MAPSLCPVWRGVWAGLAPGRTGRQGHACSLVNASFFPRRFRVGCSALDRLLTPGRTGRQGHACFPLVARGARGMHGCFTGGYGMPDHRVFSTRAVQHGPCAVGPASSRPPLVIPLVARGAPWSLGAPGAGRGRAAAHAGIQGGARGMPLVKPRGRLRRPPSSPGSTAQRSPPAAD